MEFTHLLAVLGHYQEQFKRDQGLAMHEMHLMRSFTSNQAVQRKIYNIYWNTLNTRLHIRSFIADNLVMKGLHKS